MIRKLIAALRRALTRKPSSLADRVWSAQVHNISNIGRRWI